MLLLICGLLCVRLTTSTSEWVENKGLWYFISQNQLPRSHKGAEDACGSMDAHLAVITLDQQNDFLVDRIHPDREYWIGLSTRNVIDKCGKSLQWIYDTHCKTDLRKYLNGYNSSTESACMGVTFSKKQWVIRECSENVGFICQWECKRIHYQFQLNKKFSGIYTLDHYWNGHILYIKEDNDDVIEIYKSKGNEQWELTQVHGKDYKTIAAYKNELYVPYARSMSWKINESSIISGAFCIDCEMLSARFFHNKNGSYFDETLMFNLKGAKYVSENTSFVIGLLDSNGSYKHCVCESLHYDCGISCGYIFPYPQEAINMTLFPKNYVYIENLCTNTTSIPRSTYDSNILDQNFHRIITYGISTLVIIGVSVTVSIIICLIVKRKRALAKQKSSNVSKTPNIVGSKQCDDGEYVEIDDVCSVKNSNKPHDPESVEYSYADVTKHNKSLAEPESTNQSVTSNDATANKYPGGFLAPDYGVLTGNTKHSLPSNTSTPIKTPGPDNTIYSEIKVSNLSKECKQQSNKDVTPQCQLIANPDNEQDEDLQLHENELYM